MTERPGCVGLTLPSFQSDPERVLAVAAGPPRKPASTASSPSIICSASGATPPTASGGRRWSC